MVRNVYIALDSCCIVFVGLSVFPHTNSAGSVHTGYILHIRERKLKVRTVYPTLTHRRVSGLSYQADR